MDEYNSGMDPEVKRYFRKIANSCSILALWMLSMATMGLFFGLGLYTNGLQWYNLVFYGIALASLGFMVYYFYRIWIKK